MKRPRLSISGLMVAVLIVALDFGIGRALWEPPLFSMPLTELLLIGVLPMANVLAVGLAVLVASRRVPGPRRHALIGFVTFGLAAWLALLACSFLWTHANYESVRGAVKASHLEPGLALASFVAMLFLLPPIAFAAIGWRIGQLRGRRAAIDGELDRLQEGRRGGPRR
jgi:hypothetical protein